MARATAEKESTPPHEPITNSVKGQENGIQAQANPQDGGRLSYTAFSLTYRWYITLLLGYLCLASSLTANIYFPLISLLADQYHTSIQGINLTITIYVVMQGLTPSIFSPLSDTLGRRPVYIASFALYTAASLGLALSHDSYAALVVLRALQSTGGSATLSLAYAVVADYAVHAERGRFLGPMMVATNLGPSIGPPIGGGAILATGDSRWAFWTLTIFGGSALTLILFTMRETNRKVVGNGAVSPQGMWRAWMDLLRRDSSGCTESEIPPERGGPTGKGKWTFPNLWSSVRILFHKDAFTVLYLAASPYASWYTVTTSIPLIYGDVYGYNELIVGLCYLAGGGGILAGGLIAGRLMDWNYKHVAKQAGYSVDKQAGDDIQRFPIERARSRGSYTLILMSVIGFVGYGWAVQRRVHPAVTLILQAVLGALATILHQIYSALLVDIFPDTPGTAGAANNICRCVTSAALVAALQPLVDAIGRSWFFTFIGLWHGLGSFLGVYILRRWGPRWKKERLQVRGHR
ncbi:hypothetical protein PG994_013458 [Apiospora phragmitis]|uniref:Major facilitator superfamily (MFS) profile domain-containing protein n=1 Tax=Apiospora phragmitis TaxID=2905665 RepID=A0ABR1T8Q9_9PEZI